VANILDYRVYYFCGFEKHGQDCYEVAFIATTYKGKLLVRKKSAIAVCFVRIDSSDRRLFCYD
jgi:hypothetical protein